MTHTTHDGPPAASLCAITDGRSLQLADLSLYYEVLGSGESTPLGVLNGGPGVDHTYMHCSDVWEILARERPVLQYDPRGTGRFDANIAPAVAYRIHQAITGSRFVVFEQSGHLPFYEEPDAFLEVVTSLLS